MKNTTKKALALFAAAAIMTGGTLGAFAQEAAEAELTLSTVTQITVGDQTLRHIPVTVNGAEMLPVRAYAEALGYEVDWDGENRAVSVGQASFKIDSDSYVIGRRAAEALGQAAVLIALPGDTFATTYVPVTFFTEILGHEIAVSDSTAVIE